MAANTYTYAVNMSSVPKSIEKGLESIAWDFNSGTSKLGTLSDVVLLGRIPNKALITQTAIRFGAQTLAAAHYDLVLLAVDALGTFSQIATLMGSLTSSLVAAVFTSHIPYKVSLSDDRAVQHAILALNCTTGASGTVSFSLQGHLEYLNDGSTV